MPKAGKKNHIWGDFFSEATKKNAKTGKEFGIEGKKVISLFFLKIFIGLIERHLLYSRISIEIQTCKNLA